MTETTKRLLVAVPLVAVFGGVLYAGHWLLWLVITLAAAVVAAGEWGKLAGLRGTENIVYAGLFAVLCLFGFWLLDLSPDGKAAIASAASADIAADGATDTLPKAGMGASGALLAAASVFWAVCAPLLLLAGGRKLPKLLLQVAGMLLLFVAWLAGLLLFAADVAYLAAAVLLVVIADSAAYLFGKVFGKSPMASSVSPGKTWEGFYGGFAAVLLSVVIAGRMILDAPMAWLLTAAFALTVLSVIGDLFASLLKRQAGVKDSGALLGAHGGVIDRLDAMLPVLPCAAMLAGLPA
ncbi:MAG: phosphatidate cytidylyltransferase [Gammaproteobacteria bacterium]